LAGRDLPAVSISGSGGEGTGLAFANPEDGASSGPEMCPRCRARHARGRERAATQHVRLLLEQTPGLVWTTDTDLRVLSALGAEQVEDAPTEIEGRLVADVLPDDPEVVTAHEQALTGRTARYEVAWMARWWQVSVRPLYAPDGETIIGTSGAAADITARVAALEELRRSEERLSALVRNASDAILILDEDLTVAYASPAVERVIGVPASALLDHSATAFIDEENLEEALRLWQEVLATAEPVGPITHRVVGLDGNERIVEVVHTNRLDDPAVAGVITNLRDVTDAVNARRALRESEQRFRRLTENATDLIYRLEPGPPPRVAYINPVVEEVTGYPPSAFYEDVELVRRLVHPDDPCVLDMLADEEPETVATVRFRDRDGTWRWFERHVNRVRDAGGRVVAVEVISREVTEARRAEESLKTALEHERAAVEELRRIDDMRQGFLQAVSHELRTPLTSILGFARLLADRPALPTETRARLLERLSANAERLDQLLADLLDVDRLEDRLQAPQRMPTELFALIGRTVAAMDLPTDRVRLHGERVLAEVDAPRIQRIVENLVGNALSHAPQSTAVDVRVQGHPDTVEILVDDRGPGVPDELKDEIFQPLLQGDTPAAKVGGAGLGLALVDSYTRLQGGSVVVEDRVGGGARFRVRLPRATSGTHGVTHSLTRRSPQPTLQDLDVVSRRRQWVDAADA
jgi:PAS domain S-box-containing protein